MIKNIGLEKITNLEEMEQVLKYFETPKSILTTENISKCFLEVIEAQNENLFEINLMLSSTEYIVISRTEILDEKEKANKYIEEKITNFFNKNKKMCRKDDFDAYDYLSEENDIFYYSKTNIKFTDEELQENFDDSDEWETEWEEYQLDYACDILNSLIEN